MSLWSLGSRERRTARIWKSWAKAGHVQLVMDSSLLSRKILFTLTKYYLNAWHTLWAAIYYRKVHSYSIPSHQSFRWAWLSVRWISTIWHQAWQNTFCCRICWLRLDTLRLRFIIMLYRPTRYLKRYWSKLQWMGVALRCSRSSAIVTNLCCSAGRSLPQRRSAYRSASRCRSYVWTASLRCGNQVVIATDVRLMDLLS